jgi:hypothetical protein
VTRDTKKDMENLRWNLAQELHDPQPSILNCFSSSDLLKNPAAIFTASAITV